MKEVTLDELKQLLVTNCMLRVTPEEIKNDTPLFGPDSLGLDSIDALQMTVAIENNYGVAIKDPETARQAFQSLNHLQDWLRAELDKNPKTS